jgi:hypothetical protein
MIRYLGAFGIVLLCCATAQAEWRYVARVPVVVAPAPIVVPAAPVVVADTVPYTTYYAPTVPTYVAPVMPAPMYVAPAPVVYPSWVDVRTRWGVLGPRTVIRAYP